MTCRFWELCCLKWVSNRSKAEKKQDLSEHRVWQCLVFCLEQQVDPASALARCRFLLGKVDISTNAVYNSKVDMTTNFIREAIYAKSFYPVLPGNF